MSRYKRFVVDCVGVLLQQRGVPVLVHKALAEHLHLLSCLSPECNHDGWSMGNLLEAVGVPA